MEADWVLDLRDQCIAAGAAFFFKQWGGVFKKRNRRELEGRTWSELPHYQDVARARQVARSQAPS